MGVSAAYSFIQTTDGYIGLSSFEQRMITKVDAFTATNASYVVPAGVTYMVAHITAGGGGVGSASSGAGGTSSVAFASGTISATGGPAGNFGLAGGFAAVAGQANSGQGGRYRTNDNADPGSNIQIVGFNGAEIVAGAAVTAGATLAVTVGAGGTAGTGGAAGGSGYVYLEYQVKA